MTTKTFELLWLAIIYSTVLYCSIWVFSRLVTKIPFLIGEMLVLSAAIGMIYSILPFILNGPTTIRFMDLNFGDLGIILILNIRAQNKSILSKKAFSKNFWICALFSFGAFILFFGSLRVLDHFFGLSLLGQ